MRWHTGIGQFYKNCLPISVVWIVLLIFCMTATSLAQVREIFADGEYIMGDGETMSAAEERARANAAQKAAEEAGAYVRSFTRTRDLVVEEDTIEVVANHLMEITVVSKKRQMAGDAVRFTVRIKAVISEAAIEANLAKMAEDRKTAVAYQSLKAAFSRQAEELEALKRQLEAASEKNRKKVLEEIGDHEQRFRAILAVKEGLRKLATLDLMGAESFFSRAIELDPSQAEAYAGRAEARLPYADTSSTLSDADRAVSLEPNNARFYALRAQVKAFRQCTEKKRDGCDAVFADLAQAARLDSKNPIYPVMLGKMSAELGRYEQALEAYEQAVKILPSLNMPLVAVNTYLQRADFFLLEGQPGYLEKALADVNRAVEIVTGPAVLNEETRKFARFFQEGHKGPKTEESALRIIKDIFGVDFTSLNKEEQEKWGKRYKRAAKMLNGVAQVYWKRSLVRFETGDTAGAEKDRLSACDACESPEHGITDGIIDQSSPTVRVIDSEFCTPARTYLPFSSKKDLAAFQSLSLGKRAYGKMRKEKALDHLGRAILLDPRLVEAYLTRAYVHMYVDPLDSDRAIADFSKVLEIEPKNAKALYERGLIYSMKARESIFEHDTDGARRNWETAEADFTRVLTLGDSNLAYEARRHRASVYERLERFAAAANDYAAIVNNNYELFLDKARALKLAGDRAGAVRAIDEYLTAVHALLKDQGEAGDSYIRNKIAKAEALKKELIGTKK